MFYLNGIPICIRQLEEIDLKHSFYSLMALTSEENIQLINKYTYIELFNILNNNHKIFVIINLNLNDVIGSGTIKILNKNSRYCLCIIKNIKIHNEYKNSIDNNGDNLYNIFRQSLVDYCCHQEKCSKYLFKLDDDK
jgi:hypothetical protein